MPKRIGIGAGYHATGETRSCKGGWYSRYEDSFGRGFWIWRPGPSARELAELEAIPEPHPQEMRCDACGQIVEESRAAPGSLTRQ
jgi:hypothetical protein